MTRFPAYPAARPYPFQFQPAEYMAGFLTNYTDAELGDTIALTARRLRAKSGGFKFGSHTAANIAAAWQDAALKEAGRRVAAQVIAEGV